MNIPVVFLDRDGVINRDSPQYVKNWTEFEFLPGSLDALHRLNAAGLTVILITNQSAVNRGLMPLNALQDLHTRMSAAIRANGGNLQDIFYCPHTPAEGCTCRKPEPGLIWQARAKYAIDPETAVMVGDSARDIVCGLRAGCSQTILVESGGAARAREALRRQGIRPQHIAQDLAAATDWILKQCS